MSKKQILYCHCAYARAIPKSVKNEVLNSLLESELEFEAVPDLCKLSAEKHSSLKTYSESADMNIIACYPRAVKWLFSAANNNLNDSVKIHNMRSSEAPEIIANLTEES